MSKIYKTTPEFLLSMNEVNAIPITPYVPIENRLCQIKKQIILDMFKSRHYIINSIDSGLLNRWISWKNIVTLKGKI
jgi:hypothetical protein